MLEEGEAANVYGELSRLAQAHGLHWLITDVESQIALGKQATREIEVGDAILSANSDSSPHRKSRKASFVVTRPFTEREKLFLLVEALEAASVGLSLGILNTYETIGENIHNLMGIGFAPDSVRAEVLSVTPEILRRENNVLQLGVLLSELKGSI